EEFERQFPVIGIGVRRERRQGPQIDVLAFNEVHQIAEVGCKVRGLRRGSGRRHGSESGGIVDAALTQRLAPGKDEARPGKPPLERTDGAYAAGSSKAVVLIALCAEDDCRVLVRIAE